MNQLERQRQINRNSQLVQMSNRSGFHGNCLRPRSNNSLKHEIAKFLILWEKVRQGGECLSEAKFLNGGGIADIFDLLAGEAIEIVESESEKSKIQKEGSYPVSVNFFTADEILKAWNVRVGEE